MDLSFSKLENDWPLTPGNFENFSKRYALFNDTFESKRYDKHSLTWNYWLVYTKFLTLNY